MSDRWQPDGGGRERYLAALVSWARSHGHELRVVCRSMRQGPGSALPELVEVHRGPTLLAERDLSRTLTSLRRRHPRMPVLALRPQAEATHYQLHSGLYRQAYAAERASLPSALARVLFWPALRCNPSRRLRLQAETQLLAASSTALLMPFTRCLADELRRQHGVADERIRVCPPGVDHHRFRPLAAAEAGSPPAPDQGLRLLFVGHNWVLKGLASAISALAIVRHAGVAARLTVVGRGRPARFQSLIAARGLTDAVDFVGCLPQAQLATAYQRFHVLLHPTYYDPFSLVVLEAMASGCAVVTTRACGVSELFTHGRDGYVVEGPDNVRAMADALFELIDDRRWSHMRDAGIELARGFDFDDHAPAVIAWLQATETSP